MPFNSHYHFYSRLVIGLLFLAVGVFALQQSVNTGAVSPANNIKISGWAWNDKLGWISLNCNNDFDGNGIMEDTCSTANGFRGYGLYVENDASSVPHIKGCAWVGGSNQTISTVAGWLCFSDSPQYTQIDDQVPTAPGTPTYTVNGTSVTLNWPASTDNMGVNQYYIERSVSANSGFVTIAATTNNYYINNTGLLPQTDYFYRVRAQDASLNYSDYSNEVIVRIDNCTPINITNLMAGIGTSNPQATDLVTATADNVMYLTIGLAFMPVSFPEDSITVSGLGATWTKISTNTYGYRRRVWLFQGVGGAGTGPITISYTGANASSFQEIGWVLDSATGLDLNAPNDNVATAETGLASPSFITVSTSQTPGACDATYSSLILEYPKTTNVEAAWEILGQTSTGSLGVRKIVSAWDDARDTSHTWSWLDGGNYAATFITILNNGSTVQTSPTGDQTDPTAPSNLSAQVWGSKVFLSWDDATDNVGVTQYWLQRSTAPNSGFVDIATSLKTSFTDDTFDNNPTFTTGLTYYYRIIAQDGSMRYSLPSNVITVTTQDQSKGIAIPQNDIVINSSSCQVNSGTCNNNSISCSSYQDCGSGNWCVQPLLQGVCYEYDNRSFYPSHPRDIVNYDPFNPPAAWQSCYINDVCTNYASGAECVYPQVDGRGDCKSVANGYSGQTCTFDDDCANFSTGEYCEIYIPTDFVLATPTDCTDNPSACLAGYSCIATAPETKIAYLNALDYAEVAVSANFLKMLESKATVSQSSIGFPIASPLDNNALPLAEGYDPDNPSGITSLSNPNPIQGCFNCYEEVVSRCEFSYASCTTNTDCQICSNGACSGDRTRSCTNNSQCTGLTCDTSAVINKCDNCLEYFFYNNDIVKRCDNNKTQSIVCEDSSDCNGGNCVSYSANWRCAGKDYLYCSVATEDVDCKIDDYCATAFCIDPTPSPCNDNSDCTFPDICNPNTHLCIESSRCSTDADCDIPSGQTCGARYCSVATATACSSDADCTQPIADFRSCIVKAPGTLEKVLAGYNCSDCTIANLDNSCTLNAYNQNLNRCDTCQYLFQTPGVILDNKHNRLSGSGSYANLCGWSWGSTNQGFNLSGLGWVNFSPAITTSTSPYFSVEQGNIYSSKSIVSSYRPPFRKYNASYLIESGGNITNLVSSSTLSSNFQGELSYRPLIDFLTDYDSSGKYSNTLGTLDYKGLITVTGQNNGNNINKFGSQVVAISNTSTFDIDDFLNSLYSGSPTHQALGNKVFYITSSALTGGVLTIASDMEIKIAGSVSSGAGIIIVDGDLNIDANIAYQTGGTINYLKNIPSLVWIVKGDVKIDPSVSQVAGTFVVLGNGANDCSGLGAAHCGKFLTGTQSRGVDIQLQVFGSVLARRFYLQRRFVDLNTSEPAEKFISDGRLQVNPPPGLVDFSKALPRFAN